MNHEAWAEALNVDDPVPPEFIIGMHSAPTEPDGVWMWDLPGGWTGLSNSEAGPVRAVCR